MKGRVFSDFGLPDRKIFPPELVKKENLESYLEKSDEKTYYYDIFSFGNYFIIIAPPLSFDQIVYLYGHFFFKNKVDAEKYFRSHKSEVLTTEAYTRILTCLKPKIDLTNEISSQTSRLVEILRSNKFKNISYTLQQNNSLTWIADWASWCVDKCGSDFVVIYDNASTEYKSSDIAKTIERKGINCFVMDVPYKYGPAWVPSNPWGSKHMWLQRACLEHIRSLCKLSSLDREDEILVLNTDIDELLHIPKGKMNIFDVVRKYKIDVAHFMRLPVYFSKRSENIDSISHLDHDLVKKSLNPQAPKNIFNASSLDLRSRMHQHIINSGDINAVQFIDVFASHCIGINSGWKYFTAEMKNGWVAGNSFYDYDLVNGQEVISSLVDFSDSSDNAWDIQDKLIRKEYYPD
ncbi:hypothetical protein [Alteromonas sp. 14N.309.X.WAT.G.H12]|uniref:hypothetical protein n=1 Tax=Alteromonas sp. 14N.309.X.WAT.G.H12 TaxID=3120824 RepID=UPI002FD5504D